MTWLFDPSGTTADVYNPDDELVAENIEFSGSWSGDYPAEVRDVVADRDVTAAVKGDIEQGTPDCHYRGGVFR